MNVQNGSNSWISSIDDHDDAPMIYHLAVLYTVTVFFRM